MSRNIPSFFSKKLTRDSVAINVSTKRKQDEISTVDLISTSSSNNSSYDDDESSCYEASSSSEDMEDRNDYTEEDESLLKSKTTPVDILYSLNIKKDIDSLMIVSNNPFSIITSLQIDSVCMISSSVSRLKSSKSSRFSVVLENDTRIRYRGSSIRTLSLGSFPNITLAKIMNKNIEFIFNLYWINPDFIPKLPYFHDELLLTLTASLNYARYSCMNKLYDFKEISPALVTNQNMKHYVYQQARNYIPKFCLHNRKRKNKDTPIEIKSAAVFFGEVLRCIDALAKEEYYGHEIRDFLPYDHDNAFFEDLADNQKLKILSTMASKIVKSLIFTISASNMKSIITSEYFHKEMCNPPIPENQVHAKFQKFEKECDQLFSKSIQGLFNSRGIKDDVHVYYDYGMEINTNDDNMSLLLLLNDGFSNIENIIHGHNEFNDTRASEKEMFELVESLLQETDQNEEQSSENVSEYLSWFNGMQKNKYRTFFQTDSGNWHTGNNRVRRIIKDDSVEIEHRSHSGMCSAQGYSPQSRKLQHKLLRMAFKNMDGLPHTIFSLLRQREWKEPKSTFTDTLKDTLVHLKEIEEHSRKMKEEQVSIRYECLMKLSTHTKEVKYPEGFLSLPIYSIKTSSLGNFYHARVKELTQSILSIFPKISEKPSQYSNITLFSPEVKTMLVLQSELLAYEFGASNKAGTIMKELKSTFDEQGFIGLARDSRIRLPLIESDKNMTSNILNGISPSLLPFHMETNLHELQRGVIDTSNVRIPITYTSLNSMPIHGVAETSKIPITFEQHQHLLKSLLHNFLSDQPNDSSQGTGRNLFVNVLDQDSRSSSSIETDLGTFYYSCKYDSY